ncbi:UDP-galactose transporter [Jimgerdemannia flammicorona]|uniref:UDP-galactose transporter n=2 Tax=Jimgerdemannia flammicorona TaxID=994334 RepID=A0A433A0J4_9FUNG|nr:UDP-galactose transporter [Jimgerdemannia flammicorona]
MAYTRLPSPDDVPDQPHKMYLASTAVAMSEMFKIIVCAYMIYSAHPLQKRSLRKLYNNLYTEIILQWRETAKLAIPASLYLVQNNLQYLALSLLDAATFQVTYQLKILTTALFSVLILNRTLRRIKWIALAILTVGIALVQLPPEANIFTFGAFNTQDSAAVPSDLDDDPHGSLAKRAPGVAPENTLSGFVTVLIACILSGLAGVYFEKILKAPPTPPPQQYTPLSQTDKESASPSPISYLDENPPPHADLVPKEDDALPPTAGIWIRNIQMSLFSFVLGVVFIVFLKDGKAVIRNGFFQYYTPLTWVVIGMQAGGGLIVALVVKYADNILKGFATSISIILSSLVSIWLFEFKVTTTFVIGSSMVIYASYLYGL